MHNEELVALTLRISENRSPDDAEWLRTLATALSKTNRALADLAAVTRHLRCRPCGGDGRFPGGNPPTGTCGECHGTGEEPAVTRAKRIVADGVDQGMQERAMSADRTSRFDEWIRLRAVANAARKVIEARGPKGCVLCNGRLDRPPGHGQTPCPGEGCPGHDLRHALNVLDGPFGVWVMAASSEGGKQEWAQRTPDDGLHWERAEFAVRRDAELFAEMARRNARGGWSYEIMSLTEDRCRAAT